MTRKLLTLAILALFVSASPLGHVNTAFAKSKSGSHSSGKSSSKGGGKSSSHASSGGGGGGKSAGGGGKSGGGGGKGDNPLDTAKSMMGVFGGVLGKK